MIKTFKFLIIFIACLALAACASRHAPQRLEKSTNIAALANHRLELLSSLANAKAIVFIPTDEIFQPFSDQLKPGAKQKLSQVASLIRELGNNDQVIVTAYTDDTGDRAQRFQIAHDQADTVATFLWAELIPLDHITIKAGGAAHKLASNRTVYGAKANRRIEILVR